MPPVAYLVLFILFCIGSAAVLVSVNILRKDKLYHRLSPEARPRRWVLICLLALLAVFAVCFPVYLFWPHKLISRSLMGLFGIVFVTVGLMLRNFSSMVDWYYKRKGLQLR